MTLSVLSAASEMFPLVKTGGLADVVGALPAALAPHDVVLSTLVPGYPALGPSVKGAKIVHRWPDLLGVAARLLAIELDGRPLLILDAPELFARKGGLYDHPDDWRRFAALARAAADLASGTVAGQRFDVLHAHDWQAALAAAYLRFTPGAAAPAKAVVTIHNIAFQGRFDAGIFSALGLPQDAWSINGVEYYGGVGYLKAGLQAADRITTVSPTYAREIRDSRFGMGLEGLIAARADRVTGIVNGIDTAIWNPATDGALPARYSVATLDRRIMNKHAVEQAFGLEQDDGPLLCAVSRLAWQKGMDVLASALDDLVGMGCRLALLGSGDAALEAVFMEGAARHPGRIGVRIGYDEPLSHLLQGGADAILIPSRFEPCGLTQLYGLGYGCVPIVARTGGLADTVTDTSDATLAVGTATGFQQEEVTPSALISTVLRARRIFAQPALWRDIQANGMGQDVSWRASGQRYAELYKDMVRGGGLAGGISAAPA